jgi:hypothetical protein
MTNPVQLLENRDRLSEQERRVVQAYIEGSPFQAIGEQWNVTRQRAQQVCAGALKKLGVSEEQRRELSAKHRAIINEKSRGRPVSKATRAKISAANKSHAVTEATREKIRLALLGRPKGPSSEPGSRARIAENLRRTRHARKCAHLISAYQKAPCRRRSAWRCPPPTKRDERASGEPSRSRRHDRREGLDRVTHSPISSAVLVEFGASAVLLTPMDAFELASQLIEAAKTAKRSTQKEDQK